MERLRRKKTIKTLIKDHIIESQQELITLLESKHIDVTQATLSRDMKELGIKKIKTTTGFRYVFDEEQLIIQTQELLSLEVLDVFKNEIGVFIKTLPGRAGGVAALMDRVSDGLMLTTIAGDDTIFVVPKSIQMSDDMYHKILNFVQHAEKNERRNAIKELIKTHEISSQSTLLAYLKKRGITITQATLCRDMQELGIIKKRETSTTTAYQLDPDVLTKQTLSLLAYEVTDLQSNEVGIFIKTLPGRASGVASLLDILELEDILGTIAGDDTLFVIPKTIHSIKKIQILLENYIDGFSV